MKLKLAIQGPFSVLSVAEKIESSHLPVLRAGITKLYQSGKKQMILDLTTADSASLQAPEVLASIVALREWGRNNGGRILIASSIRGLGDAGSVTECLALTTPAPLKPAGPQTPEQREVSLAHQRAALYTERTELQKKLEAANAEAVEIKKLQRENSGLRDTIGKIEEHLEAHIKNRADLADLPTSLREKAEAVSQVMEVIFKAGASKAGAKAGTPKP